LPENARSSDVENAPPLTASPTVGQLTLDQTEPPLTDTTPLLSVENEPVSESTPPLTDTTPLLANDSEPAIVVVPPVTNSVPDVTDTVAPLSQLELHASLNCELAATVIVGFDVVVTLPPDAHVAPMV
jgi:hypothetical protein